MASVREIAHHVNVSPATVSRVLNSRPGIGEATRKRVLEAATQMGMTRNVGLRTTRYIGFVHPLGQPVGNIGTYHAALIGGIGAALGQEQYDLALINPYRDKRPDENFSQFFLRKDIQGLIIQVRPQNLHVVEEIIREGFPAIQVAGKTDLPEANWVVADSGKGYEQAVEHLYHLGHRRIALAERDAEDYDHRQRTAGFERACRRLGLPLEPALRFRVPSEVRSGVSVVRQIAAMPDPPSAVLFMDPAPTRGAWRVCRELGLSVPGDLSIVGFDNDRREYDAEPFCTAVCQDAQALGTTAAACLTRMLAGTCERPVQITQPCLFEAQTTTGPPKKRNAD